MMCYMDMTFCVAGDCAKRKDCQRYLSQKVKDDAAKWWGGRVVPIAVADKFDCYEKIYLTSQP